MSGKRHGSAPRKTAPPSKPTSSPFSSSPLQARKGQTKGFKAHPSSTNRAPSLTPASASGSQTKGVQLAALDRQAVALQAQLDAINQKRAAEWQKEALSNGQKVRKPRDEANSPFIWCLEKMTDFFRMQQQQYSLVPVQHPNWRPSPATKAPAEPQRTSVQQPVQNTFQRQLDQAILQKLGPPPKKPEYQPLPPGVTPLIIPAPEDMSVAKIAIGNKLRVQMDTLFKQYVGKGMNPANAVWAVREFMEKVQKEQAKKEKVDREKEVNGMASFFLTALSGRSIC
jgi:hypothetical protein